MVALPVWREGDMSVDPEMPQDNYSDLTYIAAWFGVISAVLLFLKFIYEVIVNHAWTAMAVNHFPVTVGLPLAALFSFVIVALFRTTEGKIKFQFVGFKFEGASGPIIMWAICFLAIVAGISALWPLR
jgi:hypothetical protein